MGGEEKETKDGIRVYILLVISGCLSAQAPKGDILCTDHRESISAWGHEIP